MKNDFMRSHVGAMPLRVFPAVIVLGVTFGPARGLMDCSDARGVHLTLSFK
jgi:hypothetical protein